MDKVIQSIDELTVGRLYGAGMPIPTSGKKYFINAAKGSDGNVIGREDQAWK